MPGARHEANGAAAMLSKRLFVVAATSP